jgi:molybdopterin-containing oxidoreductase family iron-sulfur binding subunit
MCVHRVDKGQLPACAEAAPNAVIFGNLNDPTSRISQAVKALGGSQIRADLSLNTGVRYLGL